MSDYELSGDFGDQLSLDEQVPLGGQLFRHPATMQMACVLTIARDRQRTVTYRAAGEEHQMALQDFLGTHKPCRADGSLL